MQWKSEINSGNTTGFPDSVGVVCLWYTVSGMLLSELRLCLCLRPKLKIIFTHLAHCLANYDLPLPRLACVIGN